MEIERKFTLRSLPEDLNCFPHEELSQAYICRDPVIRVSKAGSMYELTVKGEGLLSREELNLPLTEEAYHNLLFKHEGKIIEKTRYRIPLDPYVIELDIFHGENEGKILAEVEFPSEEEANAFTPPSWFLKDVTFDPHWHNVNMAFDDSPGL